MLFFGLMPGSFVTLAADTGRTVTLEPYGITITPPQGWDVRKNYLGMSLVMQHPAERPEKIEAKQTFFRPNVTMTILKHSTYMDDKGAEEISGFLGKQYEKLGFKQTFIQKKFEFMPYRDHEKALVMYSHAALNDIPVTQLHVIISGDKYTSIMTYSDITSRFENDKGYLSAAYASMISTNIKGTAPSRYAGFTLYVFYGFCALLAWFGLLAARRFKRDDIEEDSLGTIENVDETLDNDGDDEVYGEGYVEEPDNEDEYAAVDWMAAKESVSHDASTLEVYSPQANHDEEPISSDAWTNLTHEEAEENPLLSESNPFSWAAGQ